MSRRNGTDTNGKGRHCTAYIPGIGTVDGRTRQARLFNDAVADIVADMGGEDAVTRAEMELVRRAAGLSVLATMAEARLLNGDPIDVTELIAIGGAQRRLLTVLGLERRARDVSRPRLQEVLQGNPQ